MSQYSISAVCRCGGSIDIEDTGGYVSYATVRADFDAWRSDHTNCTAKETEDCPMLPAEPSHTGETE